MSQAKEIEKQVELLKSGRMEGSGALYEMTKRSVYLTALAVLRDTARAEDVMQDTFIVVKDKISLYKSGTNFRAWIVMIARNLSLKEYNRATRLEPFETVEMTRGIDGMSEAILDNVYIDSLLKGLNEVERQIVIMKAALEFKHKEIAKIMDLPLGTVTWTYSNAVAKAKRFLEGGTISEE